MMHICMGLVGPKSENVEKPLVFVCFLKGQRGDEHSIGANNPPRKSGFWWKNGQKTSKNKTDEALDMRWQV